MDERKRLAELIKVEGVMPTYLVGAISANGFTVIDFSTIPELALYVPFDSVAVFNNSSSLIEFLVNQNELNKHPVAGKTEKVIDKIKLHTCRINEKSGLDIPAHAIRLTLIHSGATADSLAKEIMKKFRWF